jgi:ATP/maltotriose-dependent transcriptional regulator MalT
VTGWREQPGAIIGRDPERQAVSEFLDAIPSGLVALVIEGEAGIGKSTIFREGVAQACGRGFRILVSQPAAGEARMSFAGLSDLVEPVADELLSELALPQRRALEAALLRIDPTESGHDERSVAVAILSALRALCERSAVLIAVDDSHWLDRPTARVVDFAVRRLEHAPLGVLASVRLGGRERLSLDLERDVDSDRRQALRLGPLSLGAVHHVVRLREGVALPRRVLLKIHEVSGGNPFFALELAHALAEREELPAPGEPLPVPATLTDLVAGRLARLPPDARRALLVASALAQPTVALIGAFDHGWDAEALVAKAERRGAIIVDRGRVRFSHPLVGSTLYGNASATDRRAVHRRLAEIVPDAEQRARHLALATDGRDEPVAAALEEAADIADVRGAPLAAADLCEMAREATPSDLQGAVRRRSFRAAGYYFAAGDFERASTIAEDFVQSGVSGPERARALHLLAKLRYYSDSFPEATSLLRDALEHAGDAAAERAPIELDLAYVSHTLGEFGVAAEHARAALEHAEQLDRPGLLAEALAVAEMTEFVLGRGLNRDRLQRALALEDRARPVPANARPSLIAGMILSWVGESQAACATLEALRGWLIERGQDSELVALAVALVPATCWRGDLRAATRYAQEAFEAAAQLDTVAARGFALSALATANAHVGNVAEARSHGHESVRLLRAAGSIQIFYPLSALGFLHLSLDQPAETDRLLRPVFSMLEGSARGEPSAAPSLPDEVEALIGINELSLAESLLDGFQSRSEALDRPVSLAPALRCRGLLLAARGDRVGALAALGQALAQHELAPRPIDEARTLLAFGQIHRRANQRRAASDTLERALAIFERLGARQWAKRARAEIARLGLRRGAGNELTPTELQVAEQAAAGMTNREIAGALFISPKTVEANLARVYRKLGISSRAQLGRQMAERERTKT